VGPRPSVPSEISTGCPELDLVWEKHARQILDQPGILIPDTDEDLTWHAFLGHSIDMQGFRAAEFAGVDPLTRQAPRFVSLKQRGIGVRELAGLWRISAIQQHLIAGTRGQPFRTTIDVLRFAGGATGESLAEAMEWFPWRKGHWTVRALLQNSAILEGHGSSFRKWLRDECAQLGGFAFPPADFREAVSIAGVTMTLEEALRTRLERTFYMVGPALAAYMICDWLLWLWNEGLTGVFATYKQDSFHEDFVKRYGGGVIPSDQAGFTVWWFSMYPDLPPRLANECIWLGIEYETV
jgi:hypothetical protein